MARLAGYVFLLTSFLPAVAAAAEQINVINELKTSPYLELVEYALAATEEEYGIANLVFIESMTQGRVEQLLLTGELLQLAVFATDAKRESTLLPIYFPLSQGLLGYRVCLIKDGQHEKFQHINSLESLIKSRIMIGQGANWPDVAILRANNIQVTTNPLPLLLFEMLRQLRFDCYARGVNEVVHELNLPEAKGLVLEDTLLLFYPQPALLFVSPNKPLLAERLRKGVEQAWHSGFMQEHFEKHYGALIRQLGCEQRKLLVLENPFLSLAVQQAMQKYALDPEQLFSSQVTTCPVTVN
jgi:hypothetical protein